MQAITESLYFNLTLALPFSKADVTDSSAFILIVYHK